MKYQQTKFNMKILENKLSKLKIFLKNICMLIFRKDIEFFIE